MGCGQQAGLGNKKVVLEIPVLHGFFKEFVVAIFCAIIQTVKGVLEICGLGFPLSLKERGRL